MGLGPLARRKFGFAPNLWWLHQYGGPSRLCFRKLCYQHPSGSGGSRRRQVRKRLLDEYCIDIAGGFGPLAGKIFRVGVMGPLATPENVDLLTNALIECVV